MLEWQQLDSTGERKSDDALRHEYASRLVERGVPLAQARDLLGHASILTTERYDTRGWKPFRPQRRAWKQGIDLSPERQPRRENLQK